MKNPVNYISTSNGMFRVIVNGCPVCADKKTLSEALAVVAQMKITLCGDTMFNGDIGEFTPVNPVAPVAIVAPVVDITIKRVINAQTIINEVMQAHAIAPDEQGEYRNDFACFWPRFVPYGFEDLNESTSEYPTSAEDAHRELIYALMTEAASEVNELYMVPGKIKFQTAQKGFHTIQNTKKNLQRFADMVRKNHVAFGGGLIRAVKAKPSVSWDAKLISVFKQSIECSDFQAAFDVGAKLGALFFKSRKGEAFMQVAPVPFELDQRLVSVLNQDGKYSVIEPVSMCSVDGSSYVQKRSRAGQVENVAFRFKTFSSDSVENMFLKAHQSTADQDALRAQWLTDHGLTSEAVETRIETHEIEISEAIDAPEIVETVSLGDRFEAELAKRKATREAQAAQDVAQVVANAVAAVAISEAMQPSETREVETCQAGDGEANVSSYGSTTNTQTWAPVPEYVPCSPLKTGVGDAQKPAFSGGFEEKTSDFEENGDCEKPLTPTVGEFFGEATTAVVGSSSTYSPFAVKYAQCIRRSGPMHHFTHHCHERTNGMRTFNSTASTDRINELLSYNPDTGALTWRLDSGIRWAGKKAGSADASGYRRIEIDGKRFRAHRVAWAIVNGIWPESEIDHINGIRDDNRISNLRLVTSGQNSQNIRAPLSSNKHGFLGVKSNRGRWVATISINRNFMYLGSFATPEIAHEEYLKAKRQVHKFCTI